MASSAVRHAGTGQSFTLVTGEPCAGLREHVRRYHDFAERAVAPLARLEVASPDVVVVVDLGAGWRVGDGGERLGSFAGGASSAPTLVGHDGSARAVQLMLTPAGARALLGVPPSELAGTVVALDDLLGADAARLAEHLHAAPSSAARFALLDRLLLGRVAGAPGPRPDVAWALRRLAETGGGARVEALARELGCSRRHLSGRFAEEVGLAPKAFARLVRFQRATDLLVAPDGAPRRLADVAASCGYADQAHLNRDVRAFAGVTPTELQAQRFSFVQDGGAAAA